MARPRSFNELNRISQYAAKRVYQGRGGSLSEGVVNRALNAAVRVSTTKSYQKDIDRWLKANGNPERKKAIAEKAMNRKYSANTYLGLNKG